MEVVIIEYNAGNIRSVMLALERIGVKATLSRDPEVIAKADRVIFPGQGEAKSAMQDLEKSGLKALIPQLKQPFLGICLGLQLLCSKTEEGNVTGLGIFEEEVKRFPPRGKVPHMGWNTLSFQDTKAFEAIDSPAYFYFLHSFYAKKGPNTIAEAEYFVPFSAALQKDNFWAIQPHPEKSGEVGEQFLRNFIFQK